VVVKAKTKVVGSWQIKQRAPAWQRPSKLRKVKSEVLQSLSLDVSLTREKQ